MIIEKIVEYLNSLDIEKMTMEELEHYTKSCVAVESLELEKHQREKMLYVLEDKIKPTS